MHTLRLLTLNVGGNRSHWPARKRTVRSLLAAEAPDLVGLQEILRPQGAGISQADELGEGLGYRVGFSRGSRIVRPFPAELGNAVLSRYPIREHRTEPLPAEKEPAGLLYAVCSVRVGLLPLYVTQLSAEPAAVSVRLAQLGHIVRYIAAEQALLPDRVPDHVPILPPLLVGDLGAPPDSAELRFLTKESGFLDCPSPAGPAAGRYVLLGGEQKGPVPVLIRVGMVRLCFCEDQLGDELPVRAGLRVDLELASGA